MAWNKWKEYRQMKEKVRDGMSVREAEKYSDLSMQTYYLYKREEAKGSFNRVLTFLRLRR